MTECRLKGNLQERGQCREGRSARVEGYDRFMQVADLSRVFAENGEVFLKGVEAFCCKMNKEVAIISKKKKMRYLWFISRNSYSIKIFDALVIKKSDEERGSVHSAHRMGESGAPYRRP
ncbi:hypothetical protein LIER_19280 [Lithospermum erythrorhizon]|uniref:Uncharacterized protein n=1 Tax=Lithospermum erythrorhizon TaxID=34254 RepID=A0AAV3QIA7_LITER